MLAWIGFAAFAGDFDRVRVEIALACGAGGFGLALRFVRPAGRAPRPAAIRAEVLAFNLCLLALLAEVGLRLVSRIAPSPLTTRAIAGVEARLAAYAFRPGQLHFGFPANERGCFDEPFLPPERRTRPAVAVLGDSFSGSTVPHPFHYTTVCERALGDVELLNVGWGGLGPDEYLELLVRVAASLEPAAVVVSLFLGNDLVEVRPWNAIDRALAGWFDRGNVLLFELPRRLRVLARERRLGAAPPPETGRLETPEEVRARFPWIEDPSLEPGRFSDEEFLRFETRYARYFGAVTPRRWDALARRILDLRERAGAVPFGLVLIPDEAMVEDRLWQRILAASPGIPLDRHALRERLLAFCVERGIPVLDLWPALRAVPLEADGDRHLYLARDMHWNARGNRVAGEALAPFVRTLLGTGVPRGGAGERR